MRFNTITRANWARIQRSASKSIFQPVTHALLINHQNLLYDGQHIWIVMAIMVLIADGGDYDGRCRFSPHPILTDLPYHCPASLYSFRVCDAFIRSVSPLGYPAYRSAIVPWSRQYPVSAQSVSSQYPVSIQPVSSQCPVSVQALPCQCSNNDTSKCRQFPECPSNLPI